LNSLIVYLKNLIKDLVENVQLYPVLDMCPRAKREAGKPERSESKDGEGEIACLRRAPSARRAEALNITLVSFYVTPVILMSLAKTRKAGGSLVVTLPKELVESKKIKEGEIVEITVKKVRKDGFSVFKGMNHFTAKDELAAHE